MKMDYRRQGIKLLALFLSSSAVFLLGHGCGGGDTALSHLPRLQGIASRITLVHRQKTLRSEYGAPEKQDGDGDISSPVKMIVTAVAQAAVAAHQAYVEVRSPYWK